MAGCGFWIDMMKVAIACTSSSGTVARSRVTGSIGPAAAPCSPARPLRR
jgi:hypothetical protein